MKPIESYKEMLEEEREMQNGIWEYYKDVAYGGAYAFRIIEPQRATVLLWFCSHRWNLEALWGKSGTVVRAETQQAVEKWVEGLPR